MLTMQSSSSGNIIFLLLVATNAHASDAIQSQANHDDLELLSHAAYHKVETFCARDVERYCFPKENPLPIFFLSGDPILDWIFVSAPSANVPSAPEDHEIDHFMNQVFDSFLVSSESTYELSTAWFGDISAQILFEEAGSEHHQMARRLTEIDTKTINNHVELPFGSKNACLKRSFEQEVLSQDCANSIRMLEHTFFLETEMSRQKEAFVSRFLFYNYLYLIFLLLLARYISARRLNRRRLKRKILETVYANPSIRKQIELEIGETIDYGTKEHTSLVSRRGEKVIQNKGLLHPKNIVCEGIPVQIV